VQQLSLLAPQLFRPDPVVVQLVPEVVWHAPLVQVLVEGQAAADPQAPVDWQICSFAPEHCVWPSSQTPWHAPFTHVLFTHAVAVCQVPVELQVCGWMVDVHCPWVGPHWPPQAPLTQVWLVAQFADGYHDPVPEQVSTWLRLEHCFVPDAQTPWHEPLTHVWLTHAAAFCQVPLVLQVCGCVVDAHCVCPWPHWPPHAPPTPPTQV
jgi:hypothetical protein